MRLRHRRSHRVPDLEVLAREAQALEIRFDHGGDPNDLKAAMERLNEALMLVTEDSPLGRGLTNAVAILHDRHGQVTTSAEELDQATSMLRDLITSAPESDFDIDVYQGNLATALRHRYELLGCREDLVEALALDEELLRRHLLLPPPRRPWRSIDRSLLMNNLAKDLFLRFSSTGQLDDLDRAIVLHEQALDLVPADHFQRFGYLSNVAASRLQRFRLRGDVVDVESAVGCAKEALELVPVNSPDRPGVMTVLADALAQRASVHHEEEDSGLGPTLLFEVLQTTRPGKIYDIAAAKLADAFVQRFPRTGDVGLLELAIELTTYLVEGNHSPVDPTTWWTRGEALRLASTHDSALGNPQAARDCMRHACELALATSAMNTLHAGRQWASWAVSDGDWVQAGEAFGWCLRAVRALSGRQPIRTYKQEWLADAIGVAAEAAHALSRAGDVAKAAEAVEQCRAVLLSETLALRTLDIERLRARGRTDLGDRYERALTRLEQFQRMDRPSRSFR